MDRWDLLFHLALNIACGLWAAVLVICLHLRLRHAEVLGKWEAHHTVLVAIGLAGMLFGIWIFGTTAGPYVR